MTAGNDLARCLNWGGGLYTIKQRGLAAVLHDVEHAIVALLDRWNVCIDAAPPPASPMSPLHRMSSLSHAEPPKASSVPCSPARGFVHVRSKL